MRVFFEHLLEVIVDEVKKARDPCVVLDSPRSLDEYDFGSVIVGEGQSSAEC